MLTYWDENTNWNFSALLLDINDKKPSKVSNILERDFFIARKFSSLSSSMLFYGVRIMAWTNVYRVRNPVETSFLGIWNPKRVKKREKWNRSENINNRTI